MLTKIRKPAVAGRFYSANPDRLSAQIQRFLDNATPDFSAKHIIGLISPHAGYDYSGLVAANAYKVLAKKKFDTVVIIAPSHRVYFNHNSVYDKGGYETPLGIVPIHEEMVQELISLSEVVKFYGPAHEQEHSLEVQLPFLQIMLGEFKLVPIIMGNQNWDNCNILARALGQVLKKYENVLLVASSDLSHFHAYHEAVELDKIVLNHIENFQPERLWHDVSGHKCEACGTGPVVSALLAAKELGANKAKILKYTNSGDVELENEWGYRFSPDKTSVVGYGAAVIYRKETE